MIRKLLSFGFLLIAFCTLQAKETDDAISLWQIDHQGARVFLLGSIHALKPEMYPLDPAINAAFKSANTAVFEVDMEKTSSYQMTQAIQSLGSYPSSKSIEADLSKETLDLLSDYIKRRGLNLSDFRQLRPWLISLRIGHLELSRSGFKPDLGIDLHFQNKARKEGKTILQLETFDEQIALLAGDSKEVQDLSLRATLEEIDEVETLIDHLLRAWQQGAAEQMYKLSVNQTERYPALKTQMEKMLDTRNIKMAEKIDRFLLTKDSYFVVVGALHMGGANGLLSLLGQRYSLKQLNSARP